MPGKHGGQEMMSEPLELELQSVVSFFTYWKGKLGVLEDSSLLLTAKGCIHISIYFFIHIWLGRSLNGSMWKSIEDRQKRGIGVICFN